MSVQDWLPAAARGAVVERKLAAGETLFRIGDRSGGLFEVVTGSVRLSRVDRSGREAVLHVAGPGDTIAEASLFSPRYHCDAVAGPETTVRIYPRAAVIAAFDADAKVAKAFAAHLARQVMTLRTRIERRNIRSARERVRHFLALNTDADGRTVILNGTLKQLAAELGLTHEALYRTLAQLERAGEIRRGKGRITVSRSRRI